MPRRAAIGSLVGLLAAGCAAAIAASAALVILSAVMDSADGSISTTSHSTIPLAILGDSDSHSYQDRLAFGNDPQARGSTYRSMTFNWPEMLAQLRGKQLDLGKWGIWGNRRELFALIREVFGMPARLPRKEDYRHNFAISGAICSDLMTGRYRQAPRLLSLMDLEPERWRNAIVVIRIGVNSFGGGRSLDALADDPATPDVLATMDTCVQYIQQAVDLISERHPHTRFVLVGIFNNAHWPKNLEKWQSHAQLTHISMGLDHFDHALRALAGAAPKQRLFFDDRAWFKHLWGTRNPAGKPSYRTVDLGGKLQVTNTAGDEPWHSVVQDGHAGTVWNGLWAQALIDQLNVHFELGIEPISTEEILEAIDRARHVVR